MCNDYYSVCDVFEIYNNDILPELIGPNGPFHGKSSQVEKNKLSNSAMKTSIYYSCIAYLICSKKIENTINHCLVLAYVMNHMLHS